MDHWGHKDHTGRCRHKQGHTGRTGHNRGTRRTPSGMIEAHLAGMAGPAGMAGMACMAHT